MSDAAERARLTQRRAHARRDLEELTEQVELGEIDEATATRLRAGYEQELAEVDAALAGAPPVAAEPVDDARHPRGGDEGDRPGISTKRALIGAAALMIAFTVAIVFIGGDSVPTQQGAAADARAATPPSTFAAAEPGSLAAMEEAVAAHPERVDLRLALADAYFQQLEYSGALSQYLVVLDSDPTPDAEAVALGRVGWMAFITDQTEAAEQYLVSSLAVDPTHVEAKLFLGYVLFYGKGDAAGAIPLLEDVLAASGLTNEVRADVEGTLAMARASEAEGGE